MKKLSIQRIGAMAGIISIILYISAILPFLPGRISMYFGFTFPLLWIIAFMGMFAHLKEENDSPSLHIAYIFGIIGAALALTLIVIQQANFMWHTEALKDLSDESQIALLKATFRGTNRVQAGMDVAFDIFITISWFLFTLAIAKSKHYHHIFAYFGSLISLGLLILNMITFPSGPAESGLFDLGPFLGLWTLIFFIMMVRKV